MADSVFSPEDRVMVSDPGPTLDIHRGECGRVTEVHDLTEKAGIGRVLVKVRLDGKRKDRPFFADELEKA